MCIILHQRTAFVMMVFIKRSLINENAMKQKINDAINWIDWELFFFFVMRRKWVCKSKFERVPTTWYHFSLNVEQFHLFLSLSLFYISSVFILDPDFGTHKMETFTWIDIDRGPLLLKKKRWHWILFFFSSDQKPAVFPTWNPKWSH